MNDHNRRRGRRSRHGGPADPGPSLPSVYFETPGSDRRRRSGPDIKSLQLCRQVQQRLDLAFAELTDPWLQGLWVRHVFAEPGGRALLVEVVCPDGHPVGELLDRLESVRAHLRADIASAIHRKRTPHLTFMVVAPDASPEEDLP